MKTRWDIVHLDLATGVKPMEVANRGVFAVLWWRDLPLGQLRIEAKQLPMSAEDVARAALAAINPALEAYLAGSGVSPVSRKRRRADRRGDPQRLLRAAVSLLERVPGRRRSAAPTSSISIVVPTCGRPEQLAACLGSLGTLSDKPLEILVVDNSPSEATREIVESFPGVRYLTESRPGSSAARNTGVAHSRGSIVAFVDDDETVHAGWLGWLAAAFDDPRVALATGLVLPSELATEAQRIFEQRYSFSRGYVERTFDSRLYRRTRHFGVPVWEIGGSGNMAIRREVFARLGGFDERLGAGRAGGCEELELFYRALADGWSCRYEPRAVTEHQHRRDLASLEQQLYAYMRGHVASALLQFDAHRDLGNLRHLLWTLPKVYAGYALRSLLRDPAYRGDLLAAEIAGCLAGVAYYRRHRGHASRPDQEPAVAAGNLKTQEAVAATGG